MALFGLIKTNQERLDAYVDPEYKDLLQEARERFEWALEADEEQRERELAALKFCAPGGHWPEETKADRLDQGRPCLEVDRTNTFVRNVVNELRQMRPQPQVNPEGDGATAETAEILQGMIRHIIYLSNGDAAVDTASEAMVRCGRGYLRVLAEYSGDDSFDQDLVVRRVADPHTIVFDPTCEEADGSDANFAFVVSWVTKSEYRSMFPKSKLSDMGGKDWNALVDVAPQWADQDGVQVVEYYKRIREKKVMARLSDGSVLPKEDAKLVAESGMATIEEEREIYQYKVLWFKMNALEVLDQTVWPGRNIPIVPFYGNELVYEGKKIYYGLVEPMMDPQRHYDYMKSAEAEAIALAPKSPIIAPKGSLGTGAMRAAWNNINRRAVQVAEYEAYDTNGNPLPTPQRLSTEANVMAITQAMAGAVDDLKASSGMFDANLGNREVGQSGVAIRQLQKQGQVSNYHYQGNVARAVTYLGRILVDVTPVYYDSPRQVKIVRPDESTELAPINQDTGKQGKDGRPLVYDTKGGRYGVTISVGPSYQTKRQEDAAFMESLMQSPLGQVISQVCPDMPVRYLDSPAAKELAEILKKARPEQFQDKSEEEQPLPPEVQQQMEQMGQQMQEMDGMIQQLTESLKMAQTQIENKTLELESKERIANLQAQTELVKVYLNQQGQGDILLLKSELDQISQRLSMLGQAQPIEEPGEGPKFPESMPAEAAGFEPPEQPETAGVQAPGGQF